MLSSALKWLSRLETGLLIAVFVLMLGTACGQILLRNFFAVSWTSSDALIRLLVLWITFLGSAVASQENKHLCIDLCRFESGTVWARVIPRLRNLVSMIVCLTAAYFSYHFLRSEYEMASQALPGLPTWLAASIMPLGFTLMACRYGRMAMLGYRCQDTAQQEAEP